VIHTAAAAADFATASGARGARVVLKLAASTQPMSSVWVARTR
jgi:hypothetical protein